MASSASRFQAGSGVVLALAALGVLAGPVRAAAPDLAVTQASPAPARPSVTPGDSGGVYARDYPFIDYSSTPADNEIARLQKRLEKGEVKLEYREPRGYLDSILAALSIDPASQSVVFSKTSLQTELISARTPRALYFNDDTYVGWMPHSSILEIATMDSRLGAVFYTLLQPQGGVPRFQRETSRCLTCHDTYGMSGGGVPMFMFLTAYSREHNLIVTDAVAQTTTDATPLEARWGGWYVTGQIDGRTHLGNLPALPAAGLAEKAVDPSTPAHLGGLFDTGPYLTDTSDAAALLVFGHEVYVHDLMVRASFKSRMLMEQQQPGAGAKGLTWDQLTEVTAKRMKGLLEPLVRALLFSGAAGLPQPVQADPAFQRGFVARGPRDPQGRSLRDLDLQTRLFKHPLSFLIYSDGFKQLPVVVKDYVYQRLAEVLTGSDRSPAYAHLSADERQTILEILKSTDPAFIPYLARQQQVADWPFPAGG